MFKRGLWAEAIGPEAPLLSGQSRCDLIQNAAEMGATDLYIQIYREGVCWWAGAHDSRVTPGVSDADGVEPLRHLLELAADKDIRVHGWLNVFQLSSNFSAGQVHSLGEEIYISDNFGWRPSKADSSGSQHVNGPLTIDTPGCWLDPASLVYRRYFQKLVEDLLSQFPQLAGVHLDYIRYPYCVPIRPSSAVSFGVDFGYGESARNRFVDETEGTDSFCSGERGEILLKGYSQSCAWDDWRRNQVTALVQDLKVKWGGEFQISAAVVCWSDRAYLSALQNWRMWLEHELVDHAALMAYTRSHELLSQLVQQAVAFQREDTEVLAGIGAYLLESAGEIRKQIEIAGEAGARGVVLFSYRNLRKSGVKFSELIP